MMRSGTAPFVVLLALAGAASAPAAAAQELELWIDAVAAHARPVGFDTPVQGDAYGLGGLRLDVLTNRFGELHASAYGGQGVGAADDRWLSAEAAGRIGRPLGPLSLGLELGAYGLRYTEPFRYTTRGLLARPSLSTAVAGTVVSVSAELERGGWSSRTIVQVDGRGGPGAPAVPPIDDTVDTLSLDGELRTRGARVRLQRAVGPAWVGVTAQRLVADNGALDGRYQGVGADVAVARGALTSSAGVRWWQSPAAAGNRGRTSEIGVHVAARWAVDDRVSVNGSIGRSVSDPRYGTRGSFGASLGVSVRLARHRPPSARPVVERVEQAAGGRRVRFRMRAPDARSVAVGGDFNGWTPVPMERRGDQWSVEVTLPPGLHHFAFLVDGEDWVVPDDAPGIVEDGWGQRNASIVIEAR